LPALVNIQIYITIATKLTTAVQCNAIVLSLSLVIDRRY
jgi:hypothetical protein